MGKGKEMDELPSIRRYARQVVDVRHEKSFSPAERAAQLRMVMQNMHNYLATHSATDSIDQLVWLRNYLLPKAHKWIQQLEIEALAQSLKAKNTL